MCHLCPFSADDQSLVNQLRKDRGEKPIRFPRCVQDMKKKYIQPNGSVLENDYFDNQRVDVLAMNHVEFPKL